MVQQLEQGVALMRETDSRGTTRHLLSFIAGLPEGSREVVTKSEGIDASGQCAPVPRLGQQLASS